MFRQALIPPIFDPLSRPYWEHERRRWIAKLRLLDLYYRFGVFQDTPPIPPPDEIPGLFVPANKVYWAIECRRMVDLVKMVDEFLDYKTFD